jgi:putative nucleotidyltransferase with HDIG domain
MKLTFLQFLIESLDPIDRRNRKEMISHFLKLHQYSPWNAEHSMQVARIARDFAHFLKLDGNKVVKTALTHDVGKTEVPKNVLHKPGTLTPDERVVMNTHAVLANNLLDSLIGDHGKLARLGAKYHHTSADAIQNLVTTGSITQYDANILKIISIVDVFEALSGTSRPYKSVLPKKEAIVIMKQLPFLDQNLLYQFIHWQKTQFTNEYR